MPRAYRHWWGRRLANWLLTMMIRLGVGPSDAYLLTTYGRRTGEPHTTPVNLIEYGGRRWLVAPYGLRDWVKNLRADGRAVFGRGGRSAEPPVEELAPHEAGPILKEYVRQVRVVVRVVVPYLGIRPEAPVEEFVEAARDRPVFRIDGGLP